MIRSLFQNIPVLLVAVAIALIGQAASATAQERVTFDNVGLRRAVSAWLENQSDAEQTYGPIGDWNTWQVTDMSRLFQGATGFTADLNDWDTSQVTSLAFAFAGAESFASELGNWDVSQCTDLTSTFHGASSFTGDSIGAWNVANVESFETTFLGATSFVGSDEMANWDFSSATTTYGMFYGATLFDMNVDGWNLANVRYTDSMFTNAASFSQQVCFASGMDPRAKFYESFCGTNGAGFDASASCSSRAHQSIQAYSQACDTDGILAEMRVFERPQEFVGGLGGTGSFSSAGLPEDLEEAPTDNDNNGPVDPVITAGVQRDASAAFCERNAMLALVASTLTLFALGH